MTHATPTLVYDGDCAFCSYWVRYWQRLTGDNVRYLPLKQATKEFPKLDAEACRRAIHWIDGGNTATGAAAAVNVLRAAPGFRLWPFLYQWLPGVAWISERAYTAISKRRGLSAVTSRLLWGKERHPETYQRVIWLFERWLGLIFLIAFLSLWVQVEGLIGGDGLLPAKDYLADIGRMIQGPEKFWMLPTALWLTDADWMLHALCGLGAAGALLCLTNRIAWIGLLLCYLSYLSLQAAGQMFLGYQWDLLLLECGFLALFLRLAPRLGVTLYRWLLFRFMFLSGVVKLTSQDASWANWTALSYHFETQPLPNPLAWYADQLPASLLTAMVALTLFIELALPFLFFAARRLRLVAASLTIALQLSIIITGNYNFFNLLVLGLCLFLLDDRMLAFCKRQIGPARWRWPTWVLAPTLGLGVLLIGSTHIWMTFVQRLPPSPLIDVMRAVSPLQAINSYGVFAVMTTERLEIVIQGSNDTEDWHDYEFKYKPGRTDRGLPLVAPHQPRLDWQMWFAALSNRYRHPWFERLMTGLLKGEPRISSLFESNPFAEQPPKFVRAQTYLYRFATTQEREETGQVWVRELRGEYFPVSTLNRP